MTTIDTRTRTRTLDTSLDGIISVSDPFLTPHSKKLKALISFTPRVSHFDPSNTRSGSNEFRGFFTLFWISIFIVTLQSYVHTYQTSGHPIALAFAAMFSQHALLLAISDAVLVASTAFSVLFAIALKNNWINYYKSGLIIQHSFQALILFSAITWTLSRHWPWVQSGFLTLHAIVMIMKCHSYMAVNGYLQWVHNQHKKTKRVLDTLVEKRGGWDKVIQEAAAARIVYENPEETGSESSGGNTPEIGPDGTVTSYIDSHTAHTLRQRIIASQDPTVSTGGSGADKDALDGHVILQGSIGNNPSHLLTSHPDPKLSSVAQNLSDMSQELTSQFRNNTSKPPVTWPSNISFANFADYQLIPTLVYELEYPRTERIRPVYVLEKTIATFGSFALLYTVTAHFILPLVPTPEVKQSFWKSLLDLSTPFMVAYLLLFFIIFECICNGFAELSRFADRQFYEDWWNSTSWDEFARKWNKPVHNFLLRHVYASTMSNYKLSRRSAAALTFLCSAVFHELVMAVVTRKFRFYLFAMQMIQIPLIAVGRLPVIRKNKTLGNIVLWVGLYAGFPLLCVAYCAY